MPPRPKRNAPPLVRVRKGGSFSAAFGLAGSLVVIAFALLSRSNESADSPLFVWPWSQAAQAKRRQVGPVGSIQTVKYHAMKGDQAAGSGNHLAAAFEYTKALEDVKSLKTRPRSVEDVITFNLALSLVQLQDHPRAIGVLKKVLRTLKVGDGRMPNVHRLLAEQASHVEDWELAAKHFRLAAELQPDVGFFRSCGRALLNLGTLEGNEAALLAFQEARALNLADPASAADMGVALALLQRPDEAAPHLEECRASDELSAKDHSYVAALLEAGNPEEARRHYVLALSLMAGQLSIDASQCYSSLGRVLRRLNLPEEEAALYQEAVVAGVWKDALQRPAFVVRQPILTQPWHDLADAAHAADAWDPVRAAVAALEAAAETISAEFGAAFEKGVALRSGDEDVADQPSDWSRLVYVEDGRLSPAPELDSSLWTRLPSTAAVLDDILKDSAENLPYGCMYFSRMAPGAHLQPHSGSSSHRLRIHLGLQAPLDAQIRVGAETRPWLQDKAIVFDDSFNHEVWIGGTRRTVLVVDLWHPEIDVTARDALRAQLSSAPRLANGH